MVHYKDKLPWQQVLALSASNFSQAVLFTTPFTIAVFMVRDFEAAKRGQQPVDEQRVGRLTGLLAGTFSFASFTTAYAWGCASNYIGRKPVIVVGNLVSFISILWFGLSGSYAAAMAARVFGGFFNGILGAWKCMIGESTAALLQGKFFGYMSLAWGLGCIAGPALGGAFARPCARMRLPLCGRGQLLADRPYFLACLVASLSILASVLLSALLLEETLPPELADRGAAGALRRWRQRRRQRRGAAAEGGGAVEVVVLCGDRGGGEEGEEAWRGGAASPRAGGRARLLRAGRPLSDEPGDEDGGAEDAGGGGCGSAAPGTPLRSPSLARFRQLLRLTSRTYVGGNPFARSGSGHGSRAGSWRRAGGCGGEAAGEGGGSPGAGAAGRGGWSGYGDRDASSSSWDEGDAVALLSGAEAVRSDGAAPGTPRGAGGRAPAPSTQAAGGEGPFQCAGGNAGSRGVAARGEAAETAAGSHDGLAGGGGGAGGGAPEGGGGDGGVACAALAARDSAAAPHTITLQAAPPRERHRSDPGDAPRRQEPPAAPRSSRGQCGPPAAAPVPAPAAAADDLADDLAGSAGCVSASERWPLLQPTLGAAPASEGRPPELGRLSGSDRPGAGGLTAPLPEGRSQHAAAQGGGQPGSASGQAGAGSSGAHSGGSSSGALPPLAPGGGGGPDERREPGRDTEGAGRGGEPASPEGPAPPCCDGGGEAPGTVAARADDEGGSEGGKGAAREPPKPWYKSAQVVLTILGYGATALLFCALDETFPIFAAAPRSSGGLGLREEQIAPPLMFFGVVLMPYSLWGYPPLQRRVGTLRLARVGLAASVAAVLLIPLVADLQRASHALAMVVLYGSMVLKAFAQCSAFTGSIIMVNAAPSQEQLGAVNGVGQTLAALVRGIGPAMGGVLWAASLGLHSAGQQYLTFAIISLISVGNWFLYAHVRLPNLK